mmetsp:Transcript_16158/g.38748  ORF Transcript_16158/g.38748 Transcript_16158/m.38748 type:complete len:200 (-) Transcript_16158:2242-2841(-)
MVEPVVLLQMILFNVPNLNRSTSFFALSMSLRSKGKDDALGLRWSSMDFAISTLTGTALDGNSWSAPVSLLRPIDMCKIFPSNRARSRTSCKTSTLAIARISSLSALSFLVESFDGALSALSINSTLPAKCTACNLICGSNLVNGFANKRNTSNRILFLLFSSAFQGEEADLAIVNHSPITKRIDDTAESGTRTVLNCN